MKHTKLILALCLVVVSLFVISKTDRRFNSAYELTTTETSVYICDSESAYAYHGKSTCGGLKRCKQEVLKVTKTDAVNKYGRQACKMCY
ncbi:MAG: hypothetical protein K0S32_3052 [Bacteroidetes bacterium]|jgi:hypothetical protein|nr:hypothetical protein [Bacteroidota bacterium]